MDENYTPNNAPGKGTALASLILGIIAILTGWLYGLGCILGIVAVVLAVKSGNDDQAAGFPKSGIATAGLILGVIAIALGAGCLVCTICAGTVAGCAGIADALS